MLYLPLNVMEVIGKFLQYNTKAPVIPVSQNIDPKTTVSFFLSNRYSISCYCSIKYNEY